MGGGSWDYVHEKFREVAGRLIASKCTQRKTLGEQIMLAAIALEDIEMVDSGDYTPGSEMASIKEAIYQLEGRRIEELERQLADAALRAEVWQNHVEASARRNGKSENQEIADSLHAENQSLRAENLELQHKLEACIKTIAVISERLILEDI